MIRTCLLVRPLLAAILLSQTCMPIAVSETSGEKESSSVNESTKTLPESNPFAQPSSLPFQAPPFDRIELEHFQPALIAGMKEQLQEIDAITEQSATPTFENTIVPLEQSGRLLSRTRRVFSNLSSAHTNEHLQNIQAEMAPLLAAHSDQILLNTDLFARVRSIYESRESRQLSSEQLEVLRQHHEDFVRAGAKLTGQEQDRIRVINEQLSTLDTTFDDNLLAATKERSVLVEDVSDLDGMSD